MTKTSKEYTLTVALEDRKIAVYYGGAKMAVLNTDSEDWVWVLGKLLPVIYLKIERLGDCEEQCARDLMGAIDHLELLGPGVDILNKAVRSVDYEEAVGRQAVTIRLSDPYY